MLESDIQGSYTELCKRYVGAHEQEVVYDEAKQVDPCFRDAYNVLSYSRSG